MATEKNYLKSSVRETKFDNGGSVLNISMDPEDVKRFHKDEYGNIHLTVAKRQSIGNHKETHYIYENTYYLDKQPTKTPVRDNGPVEEDLPF